MVLEGGLHLNVIFRADIVGGDKGPLDIRRNLVNPLYGAVIFRDGAQQFFGPEAALLGDFSNSGLVSYIMMSIWRR